MYATQPAQPRPEPRRAACDVSPMKLPDHGRPDLDDVLAGSGSCHRPLAPRPLCGVCPAFVQLLPVSQRVHFRLPLYSVVYYDAVIEDPSEFVLLRNLRASRPIVRTLTQGVAINVRERGVPTRLR
jgi:hypothetical protein